MLSRKRALFVVSALLPATLSIGACFGPCTTFDGAPAPATRLPDASPDAPDGGARAYLSLPDAVRVCTLVSRCPTLAYSVLLSIGVPVYDRYFGACVDFLSSPVPPSRRGFELQQGVLADVAKNLDCNAALAQMPVELLAGSDPRCAEAGVDGCNANHALYCGDAGVGTLDRCAALRGGPLCRTVTSPTGVLTAFCADGDCNEGGVPDVHCEGTVVHTCDPRYSKSKSRFDCAWLGLACGVGPDDYATCISPGRVRAPDGGPACGLFGETRCDGDTLLLCITGADARPTAFECGDLGRSCGGGGRQSPAFCLAPDAECTPLDPDVGGCDASRKSVTLCLSGKRQTFDCSSVGLACDSAAKACR